MNKPNSLRQHLLAAVVELRNDPERLLVFIEQGAMRSTAAPGLSFEYSYDLSLIITDFAGHPDAIAIPLFAWVLKNQPELLLNLEKGRDAITFKAEFLDKDKVDLEIRLPLTERVIVQPQPDNSLLVTHPDEPQLEETFTLSTLRIETPDGELIAEWGSDG